MADFDFEMLSTFMAMTDCDNQSEAFDFLNRNGFNLKDAVDQYIAQQAGGGARSDTRRKPPTPPPAPVSGPVATRIGMFDDIDRQMMLPRPERRPFDDLYGGDVFTPPAFVGDRRPRDWVDESEQDSTSVPVRRVEPQPEEEDGLDAAFAPPSYAFPGDYRDCCRYGAADKRWVLVSLVEHGDFLSGCVNRDLLKNDMVVAAVQSFFVLYQATSSSSRGQELKVMYELRDRDVPLFAVVDPVTRAMRKQFSVLTLMEDESVKQLSPAMLCDRLIDFQDRYGLPMSGPQGPAFPAAAAENEDDEDEDLKLAIALSASEAQRKGTTTTTATATHDDHNPHVVDDNDDDGEVPEVVEVDEETPLRGRQSSFSKQPTEEGEKEVDVDITTFLAENNPGASAVRIRVKMPTGNVDLKLIETTPALTFLRFLAQELRQLATPTGASSVVTADSIDLKVGFPPQSIVIPEGDASATIASIGLKSGTVVTPHVK